MDLRELGGRIERARKIAGQSQTALGEALGIDKSAVSRIEKGERKVAVLELLSIAEKLGRPLSFFVDPVVTSVVSRRRDTEAPHDTSDLLDEELRSFSSDVQDLLAAGILIGIDRAEIGFRTPRTHEEAEQAAERLRRRMGIEPGAPLDDAEGLTERCGLVSYSAALGIGGPDGACVEVGTVGNQLGVAVVNGQAPDGRRRFTLVHELGHWLTGDAYDGQSPSSNEQMLNSFAIHLLAPRSGVLRVWSSHSDLSERDRAIHVGAEFQLSWSATVSQLRNLDLITFETRELLSRVVPGKGEFARLGLSPRAEQRLDSAPRLSRSVVASVLQAYSDQRLTSDRTLELLRSALTEEELPPLSPDARSRELASAFEGH